ncbi:MAG: hypothetical protein CMH56_16075 [Myxococcales bacterium]|nr:hypothetical protein [Myxococcales bacterium]|tara:strand:- start:2609 stop:3238 length:630 start_codon:yes stop_codon:yes gene_type:complete
MTDNSTIKNMKNASPFAKVILAMMVLSAVAVVFMRPILIRWVREEQMAPELLWAPAVVFFISLLLYVWTRAANNTSGSQKSAWLPFQVGFGLVILLLIIPGQLREYRARKTPETNTEMGMKSLLKSKDARIRALVLNAAVCSDVAPNQLHQIIQQGLQDADPLVQEAALKAVEKITGNRFDRDTTPTHVVQKSLDGFLEAANTKGANEL